MVKRARHEIDAPPAVPNDLMQLQIPENYQRYERNENENEQFLLADSGVYLENNRAQR